ncbi:hypothetical protein SPRG_12556 [Saprolegnia parasitica CBS 223.65]|uniref:Uncharacterized protein n=1 Tax=Saprolegnia parasitica (strain CBS 223.65) TaxID=695850 RepID=A0A067C7P7_SAPPC|nr:hypothetical protein SPRG_12556 [Saprolegnia parasitica CBS 223.65]KDO22576.1 hypothetical protein SPRG_12556 [Saprolegnia parasitica CBS 223.65]|eukprot:XP_012206692.1 hypothetical protein SPRG_12556 [Saprolegnia parasitica CBS 223.65]
MTEARLRADRATLKERLKAATDENELLRLRCQQEKDHFSREYAQVEARLRIANTTLERSRKHVEATILERDVKIDQLQKHLDLQQQLIESYRKQSSTMYSTIIENGTDALKKSMRSSFSRSTHATNNQTDDDETSSVHARNDRDSDARIHALEQQVTKLFGQLEDERAEADAIAAHVDQQKAVNVKLLKTIKTLKRKLDESSERSSMEQMLTDLQGRFRKVSLEQESMSAALQEANDKLARASDEIATLQSDLAAKAAQLGEASATLTARDSEVQSLLQKIGKQDHYIADLEADYKTLGTPGLAHVQTSAVQQLQQQVGRKNEELAALELRIKQLEREKALTDTRIPPTIGDDNGDATLRLSLTDLDQLYTQALRVEHKAQVIASMVASFDDGGDLNALLHTLDDPVESPMLTSIPEGKQQLLMSLLAAQSTLDNMSDTFACTYAKNLGARCAMQ